MDLATGDQRKRAGADGRPARDCAMPLGGKLESPTVSFFGQGDSRCAPRISSGINSQRPLRYKSLI